MSHSHIYGSNHDIPDATYRELKSEAASEGTSVKMLILRSVEARPRPNRRPPSTGKFITPAIPSKNPGSLKLGPEGVYEYIPFP